MYLVTYLITSLVTDSETETAVLSRVDRQQNLVFLRL